jgi:Bromodomain
MHLLALCACMHVVVVVAHAVYCWKITPPPPFSVTSPAVALPLCADPVDLSLIRARLATKSYYASLEMFVADVRRMCDNCRYYNAATTPYYSCAVKMQAAMEAALDATVLDAPAQA